jgi:UDP-glucuronate 4-epimerase
VTGASADEPSADWAAVLRDEPAVLVTGVAGFIGHHVARRLLDADVAVTGVDNLSPYYDVGLKRARLARLSGAARFRFVEADICDRAAMAALFDASGTRRVIHLAAQAGVRHSLTHPHSYAESNLAGFLVVLEECRRRRVDHLLYASSSSVYGGNAKLPFSTSDPADHPVSLYAATKKANELMAHAYCHLYGFPATGLRFFTVYGPWGRPDMAYWLFAEAIAEGRPITVHNHGDMERDFTYVDDAVEAVLRLAPRAPAANPGFDRAAATPARSWAPHRVFNVGNRRPERLLDMIAILERAVGRAARLDLQPMPQGDVRATAADTDDLAAEIGWRPNTPLDEGLDRFVAWLRDWRAGAADSSRS